MNTNEQAFFVEMARGNLLSFAVFTDQFFDILPHHKKIAKALHDLMNGDIQNLIISMPPRAGKSRLMQEFIAYLF